MVAILRVCAEVKVFLIKDGDGQGRRQVRAQSWRSSIEPPGIVSKGTGKRRRRMREMRRRRRIRERVTVLAGRAKVRGDREKSSPVRGTRTQRRGIKVRLYHTE